MRARAILVPVVTAVLAAAILLLVARMLIPASAPPSIAPARAASPRLTSHLVFVVVDGLRYDVATDSRLMPQFSRAMKQRSSAEIWSGPVSMTSAAVLAYGTGRRGDIEQIVFNETAARTELEHVPGIVKRAGLGTAATGDVAWFSLYAGAWDHEHADPKGVAIEEDYNPEIFDAARRFFALRPRPAFTVVHFVTPDHQAHAHGTTSDKYRAHIHEFDGKLFALLGELPADTTVVVTSDHGANDRGTHGTDAPIQRRSPIFAYGPGIRGNQHPAEPLDQLDLADTFAHLLGVPAPAHGAGHVLADWLDVSPEARADAACESLGRVVRLAEASGIAGARPHLDACAAGSPSERVAGARAAATSLGARVMDATPAESSSKWLALLVLALVAAGVAAATRQGEATGELGLTVRVTGVALVELVVGVLLTLSIEKLPGELSLYLQAGLTTAGVLLMLLGFVRAPAAARWLERRDLAFAAAPLAVFAATYTKYTQPLAYLFVAFGGCCLVFAATAMRPRSPLGTATLRAKLRLFGALALLLALWPLGFHTERFVSDALFQTKDRATVVVAVALAAFVLERVWRRSHERAAARILPALALAVLVVASSRVRSSLPSFVGFLGWGTAPILGLVLWRRRRLAAELLFLVAFALVSRSVELVLLLVTVFVAEALGEACGAALDEPSRRVEPPRVAVVVALVALGFSLVFVQRLGVASGLDFTQIDFSAGTFASTSTSYLQIGGANATKHLLAALATLVALFGPLDARHRSFALRGLFAMELTRVIVLAAMLFACRRSFWTALRVMSDLPHALVAAVAASLACAWLLYEPAPGAGRDPLPEAATSAP